MEKDIIILATTITHGGAFASDVQRVNVALTRARHHLVLLGCSAVLRNCSAAFRLLLESCPLTPAAGGLPLVYMQPAVPAMPAVSPQPHQPIPAIPDRGAEPNQAAMPAQPNQAAVPAESDQPAMPAQPAVPPQLHQPAVPAGHAQPNEAAIPARHAQPNQAAMPAGHAEPAAACELDEPNAMDQHNSTRQPASSTPEDESMLSPGKATRVLPGLLSGVSDQVAGRTQIALCLLHSFGQ